MALEDAIGGDLSAIDPNLGPSPVQVEENKSKWRQFLGNFQDPNVRQAILATGIGLLHSPRYGENSGDIVANALSGGAQTLQALRAMDYERGQKAQTRADTQAQRSIENRQRDTQIQQAQQQIDITQQNNAMDAGARNAGLSEAARHNQATEDIGRRQADADMLRARTYGATQVRVPAEVQKINALQAQYMTEGLDEISARAKAVMVVDSTKGAASPGEAAMNLYQNSIKNWQADINNFGKALTPQQLQQFQIDAMNTVMKFQQFNTTQTGTPQAPQIPNPGVPPQQRGTIDRSAGSAIGTVKNGYKKTKAGPDSDKTTWTKVNTSGNAK
jgi:hypothetical protein